MKYTITINQKAITEQGLPIDLIDAAILNLLYDFSASPACRRLYEGSLTYIWISPKLIIEQIPLIKMKSDTAYRRLKSLADMGFFTRHPDNKVTGQCWYVITSLTAGLFFESSPDQEPAIRQSNPIQEKSDPSDSVPTSSFTVPVFHSDPSDLNPKPLGFKSDNNTIHHNKELVEEGGGLKKNSEPIKVANALLQQIETVHQQYRQSRLNQEQCCMKLKIKPDYYLLLVDSFFTEQKALADTGQYIASQDIRIHASHWIRKQVELGNKSAYSQKKPAPTHAVSPINFGAYEVHLD